MEFVRVLSRLRILLLLPLLCWCGALLAASPDIEISGGPKSLRDNVRYYLSIAEESCTTQPWRLNALLQESEDEIQAAAQAMGYYELEYEAKLTRSDDCWGLEIQLTPGAPVLVQELRIEVLGEGEADPVFQPLFDKPGIKIGSRFNHDKYEKLKARFGSYAAAHGYFDGDFALARVEVNVAEKAARIALVYNTGVRYKIGAIAMQHRILSADFLKRYWNIAKGDPYDSDKLLELKNHYTASNYFASATATPNLQALDNGTVPIELVLEERKRHEYSIGLGAATDTGPRVLLGFEDRYINQRGHSLAADVSGSEVKSTAQLVYTIPMEKPAQEFLKLYSGYEEEETDTAITNKETYGSSYSFLQNNRWLQTYALDYQREDSIIGSAAETSTNLVIPSVAFTRTQTGGNPYPLGGWSLIAKLSGSPQTLGSDFSFVQFYSRFKAVKGFSFGRLLWRTELGTTSTVDFDGLPASVRFFAGGDQSVRGYGYKTLGPVELVEGEEQVVGGKHLLTNSLEYDYRFSDSDWVVAAFFDIGNAADEVDNPVFKRGAGLGLRWISPIGPIRLDLAKALDDDEGWRVHISMGPDL